MISPPVLSSETNVFTVSFLPNDAPQYNPPLTNDWSVLQAYHVWYDNAARAATATMHNMMAERADIAKTDAAARARAEEIAKLTHEIEIAKLQLERMRLDAQIKAAQFADRVNEHK
jgi:hypothetical protein